MRVVVIAIRLDDVILSAVTGQEQQSAFRCAKRVPAGRNRRLSSGLRPAFSESQFALRGGGAVRVAGCLLMIGE